MNWTIPLDGVNRNLKGATITSYNERNGYYAGFNIEVELKKVKP